MYNQRVFLLQLHTKMGFYPPVSMVSIFQGGEEGGREIFPKYAMKSIQFLLSRWLEQVVVV